MSIAFGTESPVFGESAITITVDDEGAGWFYVLTDHEDAKIRVTLEDLRVLLDCAEEMAKQEPQP